MSHLIAKADHPDKIKKWLPCLGCGKPMWTDRCHRICKRCRRRRDSGPIRHAHRVNLPGGAAMEERLATSS